MYLENAWELILLRINEINLKTIDNPPPENLINYLVAGEDHRYWRHFGVDIAGLIRATWRTFFCGRREGGSTIAMQLVRTITKNNEIKATRKIKEIYLSIRLTRKFDKKTILNAYLSVAYFGWNMHGVDQACKRLKLNKGELNSYEAASLIARLKYPEPRRADDKKTKSINTRANHIIRRFEKLSKDGKHGTI